MLVDAVVVAAYIGVGAGFTISPTAVTCWVCFPSHSTYEYQQSTAEAWGSCSPKYFDVHVIDVGVVVGFTICHTAVTCWVCFPSPVL